MPNSKFSGREGQILNSAKSGFTLIELLIGIAILTIVVGVGSVSWLGFRAKSEADTNSRNIADALKNAQTNSITGEGFTTWGVHFESSSSPFYQIFSGADWASGTKGDYYPLSDATVFNIPTPGATPGEKVEIEVSYNTDVSTSDSSAVQGEPVVISGTTTLQ